MTRRTQLSLPTEEEQYGQDSKKDMSITENQGTLEKIHPEERVGKYLQEEPEDRDHSRCNKGMNNQQEMEEGTRDNLEDQEIQEGQEALEEIQEGQEALEGIQEDPEVLEVIREDQEALVETQEIQEALVGTQETREDQEVRAEIKEAQGPMEISQYITQEEIPGWE